jgi:hypothetical protein
LRIQASGLGQYSETRSRGYASLRVRSYWAKLMRSTTAQVVAFGVRIRHGLGRQPSAPNARTISVRSARRELVAVHRVPRLAAVFGGLQQPRSNRLPIAVAVRSPPSEARASPRSRSRANHPVAFWVDEVLRSHRSISSRNARFSFLVLSSVRLRSSMSVPVAYQRTRRPRSSRNGLYRMRNQRYWPSFRSARCSISNGMPRESACRY